MKNNKFNLTPANKVCFIYGSNFRVGTCNILIAKKILTTKLKEICYNCLQTNLNKIRK